MKKLNGLQVGEYEIVDEIIENDEEYEYEEIIIQELLDRNGYDETEQKQFINKYNAINIHFMIANETFDKARSLIYDRQNDERLAKMNAIVFLSLKKKGRAENRYTQLSQEKFTELVNEALSNNVAIGFDSCSAFKFLRSVGNDSEYEKYIEPCESTRFSLYVNVKGEFYPCSFLEGENVNGGGDWTNGIDVISCENFLSDVWNNEKTKMFRNKCIKCVSDKISCSYYEI